MIPGLDYAETLADLFDSDAACPHGVGVDSNCEICDAEIGDMEPTADEAIAAIAEYNAAYARGEEPHYPHWADEILRGK